MRKLIVSEFLSLDGVMQSPGAPDEDSSGGFEHGGWQQRYSDQVFGRFVLEGLQTTGGLLLGRVTYEIFAGYWPSVPADDPWGATMNALPKYVVSTTLEEPLSWENSTLIAEDVPGRIGRLKEEDGQDIRVIGSSKVAQTLMEHDLVDEYQLMIHPLVLGSGKRLFREGNPMTALRLVESAPSTTGVILVQYVPANRKEANGRARVE